MDSIGDFFFQKVQSELQEIDNSVFFSNGCSLTMLREDKIHPSVSGNKYRKLKYNLLAAQNDKFSRLLTFGGAYSNHIAAVATLGKETGMHTIGVIRGEEIAEKITENPTLSYARNCGMELIFVSRADYSLRNSEDFTSSLRKKYGDFYLIPEGGTNTPAVVGCEEILTERTSAYDYICVSVGTGGTIAGLVRASLPNQSVFGFSALKGIFQTSEVKKYTDKINFEINDTYCFGGYAKIDLHLIRFINEFKISTGIQLDPIYTGKMMFGISDMLKKNIFKENSRILAVHTGGLQGIAGMNQKLKLKNLPQIIV